MSLHHRIGKNIPPGQHKLSPYVVKRTMLLSENLYPYPYPPTKKLIGFGSFEKVNLKLAGGGPDPWTPPASYAPVGSYYNKHTLISRNHIGISRGGLLLRRSSGNVADGGVMGSVWGDCVEGLLEGEIGCDRGVACEGRGPSNVWDVCASGFG